ncbi:MAG TPA: 5'-3' exonuclease H3TH domain-containing protein, partial [Candidatus Sulfotelmatobacter sp.]|nr:5'-3' exonuclease H3TH domain-containing protein [Candidatus Sulfotelmatobacter sp.]
IIEDLRPEYLVVCFDRKAPTFRKQMYVGYQATRPSLSDDFIPQIELDHKALDAAKINHLGIDGYEADDLIGTLSKKGVEKDLQVIIVSGDRDLLQLVNSHVLMLAPVVGITNMTLFDERKVKEKYGLLPSQIIDYKALVGDSSDNYPGVSGIGPKGAANLLQKYQNLENLYAHISDLPVGIQEKLAQDAEQSALAKKLATIICDVPLTFDMDKSELKKIDKDSLISYFGNLGFNTIRERTAKVLDKIKREEKAKVSKKEDKKKEDSQLGFL